MKTNIESGAASFRNSQEIGQSRLPWILAGLFIVLGLFTLSINFQIVLAADNFLLTLGTAVIYLFLLPAIFAGLGALILTRRPGHRVGWLMMAAGYADPFGSLAGLLELTPGMVLTPGEWLLVWYSDWAWLIPVVAILLIVLNFPDGKPPSPRWNWIGWVAVAMFFFNVLTSALYVSLGPDWIDTMREENPTGWFSIMAQGIDVLWALFAGVGIGGSLASLLVRFRRGRLVEREQLKWLLFAGAFFLFAFVLNLLTWESNEATWESLLFGLSFASIPLAIAIAILRYRLYDINLIIRNTLLYTLLTGTLAVVYFGLVILLQRFLPTQTQLTTVLSTLTIAALFSPLRRRIQNDIDRLFFRRRYDADQTLETFSLQTRDGVDLEQLNQVLMAAVEETMQPAFVQVWLRERGQKPETQS